MVFLVPDVGGDHLVDGRRGAYGEIILKMKKSSYHIIRVGLAITFIWIGVLIFKDPQSWAGYIKPWAVDILPIPLNQAIIFTAIFDIIVGALLLIDWQSRIAGILAAIHLIIVLIVGGITDITVRDIGLLTACIAIIIESSPFRRHNS